MWPGALRGLPAPRRRRQREQRRRRRKRTWRKRGVGADAAAKDQGWRRRGERERAESAPARSTCGGGTAPPFCAPPPCRVLTEPPPPFCGPQAAATSAAENLLCSPQIRLGTGRGWVSPGGPSPGPSLRGCQFPPHPHPPCWSRGSARVWRSEHRGTQEHQSHTDRCTGVPRDPLGIQRHTGKNKHTHRTKPVLVSTTVGMGRLLSSEASRGQE